MYKYEELPVATALATTPVQMPIRVLLALPKYVTDDPALHPFNLPGAVNYLMGSSGWARAVKVMRPHVWAPGWDRTQLVSFVTAPFGDKQRTFIRAGLVKLRVTHFPGTRGRVDMNAGKTPVYEIVHVLGNVELASWTNDPSLRLGFEGGVVRSDDYVKGRALTAGALRDALVAAKTRLLILQVAHYRKSNALDLARFVVGSGGPAVLVVAGLDASSLDEYFLGVYAGIIHNQFLHDAATPQTKRIADNLSVSLLHGLGGNELLRFDRWLAKLNQSLDHYQELTVRTNEAVEEELAELRPYLHRAQVSRVASRPFMVEGAPVALHHTMLEELNHLRSNINWAHESGGAIPLTEIAEKMPQVRAALSTLESSYPRLHELLAAETQEMARHAPRVLNAGFVDPQTQQPVEPRQALVAAQEYDLLVDVGPRWNKLQSLVTGNAEFPEAALPPDEDGYLIKVVLLSEDFQAVDDAPAGAGAEDGTDDLDLPAELEGESRGISPHIVDITPTTGDDPLAASFSRDFQPCTLSQWIWVPRHTGRSFPVINSKRSKHAGPVLLRLRTPEFPVGSTEQFITARARLCLYYQNNLLQSARMRVHVARTPDHPMFDVANEITVDFVLTGSFQDIGQYATRTLVSADGTKTECAVGLNLTLNDDGAGGHRIIIEHHKELTVWRPYDPDAAKDALDLTREKLKNCFWLKNTDTCEIDEADEAARRNALQADNGKTLRQFKCDLYKLALQGFDLYEDALGQLSLSNQMQWRARLRKALAEKKVIQVARTSQAQYVFPWALLYDIPLPDRKVHGRLRWCKVLEEEWPNGRRTLPPKDACPYHGEEAENILCPYGFWGLKHIIEQPINIQKVEADDQGNPKQPADVYVKLMISNAPDLKIGVTRDKSLDARLINNHLAIIQGIAAYKPDKGADDWDKVKIMLEAPELVYFLCHGEYDQKSKQPYLGVGLRDEDGLHRVYPKELTSWASTKGETFWQNRHPLIFINGCHTSNLRPGEILSFVTTFANFGASGVIGTEVSIRLPLATEVAEALLRKLVPGALVAGESVGEAMRQIRWDLVNKGNLLGLAYTPYCMSSLHLERAAQ